MPHARNQRRTRLTLTLAGLALAAIGLITYGNGSIAAGAAEQAIIGASAESWDAVLDADGIRSGSMAEAQAAKSDAESQMTFGVVLGVAGLALAGSRWLIRPGSES